MFDTSLSTRIWQKCSASVSYPHRFFRTYRPPLDVDDLDDPEALAKAETAISVFKTAQKIQEYVAQEQQARATAVTTAGTTSEPVVFERTSTNSPPNSSN